MKLGRPSDYSLKIAEEICDAIASTSHGLRRLCKENPHWPERRNIYHWLKKHKDFRHLYAQSKEFQVESLIDEILEIADDDSRDTITKIDENGSEKENCNSEWINRSRLRIDTRKWLAAKLCPRIYGDNSLSKKEEVESAADALKRINGDNQ
jgi:hypothetical protein